MKNYTQLVVQSCSNKINIFNFFLVLSNVLTTMDESKIVRISNDFNIKIIVEKILFSLRLSLLMSFCEIVDAYLSQRFR